MMNHFELPANLSAEQLLAALGERVQTHLVNKQYCLKTYYDSFDWRLYKAGVICVLNRSKQASVLTLFDRKSNDIIAATAIFDMPTFAGQFSPGKVRKTLEAILAMRALSAVCTLECESYQINVLDEFGQTGLYVQAEAFDLLKSRLTIMPLKGHEKYAKQFATLLVDEFGLLAVDKPVLVSALRLQGRHPKDYSTKLSLELMPDMAADAAVKLIFKALLKNIKANEQGVIADTDSEFLHDFRVSIRKIRVALGLLSEVLPEAVVAKYKAFFSWLGQITSETRDLDVYLLNFAQYQKKLPADIRQDIDPLQHYLLAKKQKAHRQLAKKLKSAKYLKTISEWATLLNSTSPALTEGIQIIQPIKALADQRIWKTYQQALKQGRVIDKHAPPEALHKLRKTFKKLRYLMEFFQNLYPERKLEKLLKAMKGLQEVLGGYQDYAVQQERLRQIAGELQATDLEGNAVRAMAVLIQDFESRQQKARNRFDSQFAKFDTGKNHNVFANLFN